MFHFGTNTKNGGTASCRSAVFFAARRRMRGEDFEKRRGEDFERMEEDGRGAGEDGNGTLRGRNKDSEQDKTMTLRRAKTELLGGEKRESGIM